MGIVAISTIIGAGVLAAFIAMKLRLPALVCYLLAGVALTVFIPDSVHQLSVEDLALFASTLLLFSLGIEFPIEDTKRFFKLAVGGVVVQSLLSIMLAIIVLPMLGFSDYEALFLGMMTSLSSMLFVVSMVQAKKLVHTNAGKIMLAWVGFQSIVVVVWFLFLVQFAPNSTAQADPILAVVNSLLAMAGAYLLWKYILPFALLQVAKAKSEELLLLTVFAAVTVFAVMASVLELPAPIIAFLAGLMLAGVAKRYELLSGLKEFKGIFTLVFFVAIGALLDLSGLNENMALLLVILVIMLPIKIVVIIGINVWAKMHIKTAIKVGLGIGQIGELAFVVSYLAVHAGWIDGAIYSTVVAAAVVSMMLTPVMYLLVDWLYNFLERRMRSLSPNVHRGLFLSALPDEDDET